MTEQELQEAADCLHRLAAAASANGATARAKTLTVLAEDCEAELMLTRIVGTATA